MRQQRPLADQMAKQLKFAMPCAAVAVGLLTSCAHGQLFGSPPSRDVEDGAQAAKLVEQQIGLYTIPEADGYLRKVGNRLVTVVNDSRWQFSFQIVDQAEPNAFSIPGGAVYVSRGLLALIDREDELAGVLAHEIAHVTQRHVARQQPGTSEGLGADFIQKQGTVVSQFKAARIHIYWQATRF